MDFFFIFQKRRMQFLIHVQRPLSAERVQEGKLEPSWRKRPSRVHSLVEKWISLLKKIAKIFLEMNIRLQLYQICRVCLCFGPIPSGMKCRENVRCNKAPRQILRRHSLWTAPYYYLLSNDLWKSVHQFDLVAGKFDRHYFQGFQKNKYFKWILQNSKNFYRQK